MRRWLVLPIVFVLQTSCGSSDSGESGGAGGPSEDAGADVSDASSDTSAGDGGGDAPPPDGGAADAPVADADASDADAAGDGGVTCSDPGGSTSGSPADAVWARSFDGGGSFGNVKTATDALGNVYVAGNFKGTIDLAGAGDAGTGALTSAGKEDVFVAKFDATGAHQWSKRFGDDAYQYLYGLALDVAGHLYLTGAFYGGINFAATGDAGTENLVAPGTFASAYLAKLDADGNHLWSHSFGDGTGGEYPDGLAVDGTGNVVIAGMLRGDMSFPLPGGGTETLTSAGSGDAFVAKFATDGSYLWGKAYGSAGDQSATTVATDAAGNVYVSGYFDSLIDFTGGAGAALAPPVDGNFGTFLAKLDHDGKHVWSKGFGNSNGYQNDQFVAVTPGGEVYLFLDAKGDVNFAGTGPGGSENLAGAGGADLFIAKFTTDGDHQWSQRYGDDQDQWVGPVAVDAAGDVYLTGGFKGSVDFAGTGGPASFTAVGYDAYAVKLAASGAHQWSRAYGDSADQYGWTIAVDGCSQHVLFGGAFGGSMTFPRTGGASDAVLSATATDMFLARLLP